jgi:hypothetical protein
LDAINPGIRPFQLKADTSLTVASPASAYSPTNPSKAPASKSTIAQTLDRKFPWNDRASSNNNYRKVTRGPIFAFCSFVHDKGFADTACRPSTLLSIKNNANSPARKLCMTSVHKSSWRQMRERISYYGDAKKFSYGSKL